MNYYTMIISFAMFDPAKVVKKTDFGKTKKFGKNRLLYKWGIFQLLISFLLISKNSITNLMQNYIQKILFYIEQYVYAILKTRSLSV